MKNANWIFTKKKGIAGKFLSIDSVSHATLKSGDILESFYRYFSPVQHRAPKGLAKKWRSLLSYRQWVRGTFDADFWSDTGKDEHLDECNEMLELLESWAYENNYLLPCHYIGANEGDGANFGVWPSWSAIDDLSRYDEIPVFSDGRDAKHPVPDVLPAGDCLVINERGNITYFRNRKELFSYV